MQASASTEDQQRLVSELINLVYRESTGWIMLKLALLECPTSHLIGISVSKPETEDILSGTEVLYVHNFVRVLFVERGSQSTDLGGIA